nr:MAG TPA: secretion system protein [Caudoviricetes sp.]
MSGHKVSGIHAFDVEVPEDMSLKELMERLLNEGEVELEKELDGETRRPEPQPEADKWQRYADMLGDLFDVAHQIGYDAYMQGDLKIMRKVLQVESDVVDLAGIVTTEKSRAVK